MLDADDLECAVLYLIIKAAMTAACLATVALYLLAVWLLPKFGVSL